MPALDFLQPLPNVKAFPKAVVRFIFPEDEDNELFKIYAEKHLKAINYTILFLVAIIVQTQLFSGGLDAGYFKYRLLYLVGFIGFLLQYRQYSLLKEEQSLKPRKILILIANKIVYSIAFLHFLFFPLHVDDVYQHVLNYFFVLIAMVRFISASQTYMPLFLAEMAVYIAFPFYVLALNFKPGENNFLFPVFVVLTFGSIFMAGLKSHVTSVALLKKKYELKTAVRYAEEAVRVKSDFLATMSHEIRTPLSGIMGMIKFLKQAPLSAEHKECIDLIDSCSKNLLNTLNDILDASKMEAGKFTIDEVSFDLYHQVRNLNKLLKPKAQEAGVEFNLKIEKGVPQYILSDPNRLQQILMNLANNALKFTKQGSVTVSLSMRHTSGPFILFEIIDTGIGISPENQQKLFKSFSQVDGSIARKFGGTGLGLSIAKQLVEMMGGEIGIHSEEGKGSTFWFQLPAVVAESLINDDELAPDMVMPTGLRILVAEDNHVNRLIMARLLELQKYRVDFANDGQQAIDKVQEKEYDLVLMDMQMPGKDGLQATREIRALGERFEAVPIIGLTANIMEEQIRECIAAGMVDHISKPIDPKIMFKKLAFYAPKDKSEPAPVVQAAPVDTPKARLPELRAMMGEKYVTEFIAKANEEILRIAKELDAVVDNPDMKTIHKHAHDIVGIAGTIDRTDLVTSMRLLQAYARENDVDAIRKHIADIRWT